MPQAGMVGLVWIAAEIGPVEPAGPAVGVVEGEHTLPVAAEVGVLAQCRSAI